VDNTADIKEELRKANWLFAQECVFKAGAATRSALPEGVLPEIAFVGRSNVGKSTLINSLTGRRTLVRVSQTPGRTRQVNFFSLGGYLMLVDLPGYGFAQASKKDIAGWTGLMRDYLRGRTKLQRVCLLIDSRHGLKPSDRTIMELLDDAAVCYQVILTKADKAIMTEVRELAASLQGQASDYPAMHPDVLLTSSREGVGIEALRLELARFAQF
jgi:GTP-binding protein